MNRANTKKKLVVEGSTLAYVDQGTGAPVVFLHGNPTSSYLWRNMIGPLAARYRCLAPDLIGMGDSDKLPAAGPDTYDFDTNRRYLDAWFDAVVPSAPVVLVVHDWGSALGFDWARRHPERVRAIAYMEPIIGSMPLGELPPAGQAFFATLRSPAGEPLVLQENVFLERMLSSPEGTLAPLSDADREEYRRPFVEPGAARWPTLSWPRQLPYDGQPANICAIADAYRAYLAQSDVPKLFVNAEPGRILAGGLREVCRSFPNQREVSVRGLHYPQEDSPLEVTDALWTFLSEIITVDPQVATA